MADEIPDADGPPVRVRLLGEDLVGFRDSNGRPALIGAYCPHRRAPLFFGRNEECGLRCVYHGWKFDAQGACVDMPSEPPDSLFKSKVQIDAYPTWEGGGMIWTYMGPPEHQPAPPDHELVRVPETHRFVSKTLEECNFLQALEGGVDPTHAGFLHSNNKGDRTFLNRFEQLVAGLDIEKTEYGFTYAGIRLHPEFTWIRGYHWILPSYHMRGSDAGLFRAKHNYDGVSTINGHIFIPIDDEHTYVYNFMHTLDPDIPLPPGFAQKAEDRSGRGKHVMAGFRPAQNASNDYMIDRNAQKTETFTGIPGINTQDFAVQEGMGPIVDRTKEHLGTTDRAIITLRQVLMEALEAMETGRPIRGTDPATYRGVRAVDRLVPKDLDWKDATREHAKARF
jgi:phthalate 4,5-dioxygenase